MRKRKFPLILEKLYHGNIYVRENPISWNVPTEILYAGNDNLTSRQTVDRFVNSHNSNLTVMDNGEHWFYTDEQLAFLDNWMKKAVC